MAECRERRICLDGSVQLPVAFLSCNFSMPVGEDPALLTHNEVVTLFHEFGHGLHHMLTKIDYSSVSGINGVAWDAVELPSQLMENWCWQEDALAFISGHYQTGESLPKEMLEKMLSAKNFHAAMRMMRQLEFALFDFQLHIEKPPYLQANIQQLLDHVRQRVSVVPVPALNRFQNGFAHIFGGGYAAGYYSYKWAEVLAADAFGAFEEAGIFDTETADRFRREILEIGGSRDFMEAYIAFRGRRPTLDALLRQNGIGKAA